jgi:hypothetical protein
MKPQHYSWVDVLLHAAKRQPKVYLAGKIRKNCWRHQLVKGLREHGWENGHLRQDEFTYIGPFFVGCDHGCYHVPNQHGNSLGCKSESNALRSQIAANCRRAVNKADLVFCYIDAIECYGTMAEIERAKFRGARVVIAFAPGVACSSLNDFWFACEGAHEIHYNVRPEDLPALLKLALKGVV